MNSIFTLASAPSFSLGTLFGLTPVNSSNIFSVGLPLLQSASAVKGQTQISGYGQLLSALSTFQQAVKGLGQAEALSSPTALSSNSRVAGGNATSVAAAGTYHLNVTQLAQAQSATSAAVASPDTILGSGTLSIQTGSYDAGGNLFAPDQAALTVSLNNGTLSDIARAINGAQAGVTANVIQDNGAYRLQLQSAATGAAHGFKLTTVDYDGSNTNTSGLSQLAFDPTAAAGNGKNLSLTQVAGNAAYTVNGVNAVSASNTAAQLADGVSANLLQAGATDITVAQDFKGLAASAEKLVSAFNTLQDAVGKQLAGGGQLHGDVQGIALAADLAQQAKGTFDHGAGALEALSDIGIKFLASAASASGGSLTLDSNALQTALAGDPKGTVEVLTQAVQGFDAVAEKYGGSAGSIQAASQGLQLLQSLSSLGLNAPSDNVSTPSSVFGAPSPFDGAANTRLGIHAIQAYAQDQLLFGGSVGNALLVSGLFGAKKPPAGSLLSTFA